MLSPAGLYALQRHWWESFFLSLPISSEPLQYKQQLEQLGILYKEPCATFIYDDSYESPRDKRYNWHAPTCGNGLEPIITGFALPDIQAVSGNSLTSSFNRNPVHPRLFSVRDERLEV